MVGAGGPAANNRHLRFLYKFGAFKGTTVKRKVGLENAPFGDGGTCLEGETQNVRRGRRRKSRILYINNEEYMRN